MRLSAENVLRGQIVEITEGAVNALVKLDVQGAILTADISVQAVRDLELKPGLPAVAVIKANDVMVSTESRLRLSARNIVVGEVQGIENGTINGRVTIRSENGFTIVAGLSWRSIQELGLKKGVKVTAAVKAASVMVGLE